MPRAELLAKAFMKLLFWNPQEDKEPLTPLFCQDSTEKLTSTMAPLTSPRIGGSVPISLPDHIFSLGAQHILPLSSLILFRSLNCMHCSSLLWYSIAIMVSPLIAECLVKGTYCFKWYSCLFHSVRAMNICWVSFMYQELGYRVNGQKTAWGLRNLLSQWGKSVSKEVYRKF